MANGAVAEHRHVRGAAADVDEADPEFALVVGEAGARRCELFQDQVMRLETAADDAFLDVLGGVERAGNDMHARFEAHAGHADGLLDAFLVVDDVFLRQHMQHFLVGRNGQRSSRIDHPVDVVRGDLAVSNRDDAVGVEAADVTAGDAGVHRVDGAVTDQLGLFDRPLDGLHGGFDVHHDAFLEAVGTVGADADDLEATVRLHFAHYGCHLAGADVEAHDPSLLLFA